MSRRSRFVSGSLVSTSSCLVSIVEGSARVVPAMAVLIDVEGPPLGIPSARRAAPVRRDVGQPLNGGNTTVKTAPRRPPSNKSWP